MQKNRVKDLIASGIRFNFSCYRAPENNLTKSMDHTAIEKYRSIHHTTLMYIDIFSKQINLIRTEQVIGRK